MRALFFSFLFLIGNIIAEDHSSLAVTEGMPSSFIEGCVSAITGDLYLQYEDIVIKGAQPIHIPRCYLSHYDHAFGGWLTFQHHIARFKKSFPQFLYINEPNGTTITYDCFEHGYAQLKNTVVSLRKKKDPPFTFIVHPFFFQIGLTNCKNGEISGRKNYQNNIIKMSPTFKSMTLYCADGTERYFKRTSITEDPESGFYILKHERLPNKNIIFYSYSKDYHLEKIHTTNPQGTKTYAWATFTWKYKKKSKEPKALSIKTSDGKSLNYHFKSHKKSAYLSQVENSHAPQEQIQYLEKNNKGYLLECLIKPNKRIFQFDYYDLNESKAEKNPSLFKRIKNISASTSPNEIEITHRISYTKCNPNEPGETEVTDALGHRTVYNYHKDLRLDCISHYQTENHTESLLLKEQILWDKNFFKGKVLYDQTNQPIFAKIYTYDAHGNVIEETLYSNLSGSSFSPLIFDQDHLPSKKQNESYSKYRAYTKDNRNLLISESEDNGNETTYAYLPGTDLISAKFTWHKNAIKIRTFYEYNEENLLIREITDDGSSEDIKDTSFNYRFIKEITPRQDPAFYGLPDGISEKYVDPKTSQECLLKRSRLFYSDQGEIIKKEIFDSQNHIRYALHFTYDEHGHLIQETDPLGQITSYSYDENGNKIFEKSPSGKITLFSYDHANRLIETCEQNSEEKRIKKYSYDLLGNLEQSIDEFEASITFKYDALGHCTETISHPIHTFSEYDSFGNKISFQDGNGHKTLTTFNAYGSPCKIIYPDETQELLLYNLDGSLKEHINQEGVSQIYTRDFLGRIIYNSLTHETWEYDSFNLLSYTNPDGIKTTYTYDEAGRKIQATTEDETTFFTYDSLGRVRSTQKEVQISIKEYDLLDRVIEERIENADKKCFFLKRYTYDSSGNIVKTTKYIDGKISKEKTSYDLLRRLIKSTDPEGHETHYKYTFNPHQKITLEPNLKTTVETYDAFSRLIHLEKKQGGLVLADETYIYDNAHNLTKKTSQRYIEGLFDKIIETTYEYDALNRLTTLIESPNKITRTSYTPSGKIKTLTKPDGNILFYTYDERNNLIDLYASDAALHYTFTYNNSGNLLSSYNHLTEESTKRQLDFRGRILEEKLANGLTLQYSYDRLGRKTSLTLPDNTTIFYAYDALNLLSVSYEGHTHTYDNYDLSGNLLSETFINQIAAHYSYDLLSRKRSLKTQTITQENLSYDVIGNLLERSTNEYIYTYKYDAFDQLIEDPYHAYRYDSHHNLIQKDATAFPINSLNQISTLSYDFNGNLIFDGKNTYAYDSLDRLIEVKTPDSLITYTYDSLDRRLSKTTSQEKTIYLYDGKNEIGAYDTAQNPLELRILGNTPHAEIGASILFILQGKSYIPIHDLSGNIIQLLDNQTPLEHYSYTPFGEEISSASLSPWRFSSKRFDKETGLTYFGRRYYHPTLCRWLSPDPKGFRNSANLYAFTLNNPLTHFDLYGLEAQKRLIDIFIRNYAGYNLSHFENVENHWTPITGGIVHGVPSSIASTVQGLLNLAFQDTSIYHNDDPIRTHLSYQTTINLRTPTENYMQTIFPVDRSNPYYQSSMFLTELTTDSLLFSSLAKGLKSPSLNLNISKEVAGFNKFGLNIVTNSSETLGSYLQKTTLANSKTWTNFINPFKGKTFQEIDQLFCSKNFITKGPDPLHGKGSYFSPITNRKYYLDYAGKLYKNGLTELPHVDVHYNIPVNGIEKQRFPIGEYLYEYK